MTCYASNVCCMAISIWYDVLFFPTRFFNGPFYLSVQCTVYTQFFSYFLGCFFFCLLNICSSFCLFLLNCCLNAMWWEPLCANQMNFAHHSMRNKYFENNLNSCHLTCNAKTMRDCMISFGPFKWNGSFCFVRQIKVSLCYNSQMRHNISGYQMADICWMWNHIHCDQYRFSTSCTMNICLKSMLCIWLGHSMLNRLKFSNIDHFWPDHKFSAAVFLFSRSVCALICLHFSVWIRLFSSFSRAERMKLNKKKKVKKMFDRCVFKSVSQHMFARVCLGRYRKTSANPTV